MKIAFVTCNKLAGVTPDDSIGLDALVCAGFPVSAFAWDAPGIMWEAFDAVILRSTWDYHLRPQEFAAWLAEMEVRKVRLWNPAAMVRANMDKRYLHALSQQGIPVIPTIWLELAERMDLAELLSARGWEQAVVKPTISGSATGTWVASLGCSRSEAEVAQRTLDAQLERTGVMIQPFVKEVQTRGEWSLIFFDRQYSHAVLKRAKVGDFRVQSEFGGYFEDETPRAAVIAAAERVLAQVSGPMLYARVDGVEVNGEFRLMELELIEPDLFFRAHSQAPRRFADALVKLSGHGASWPASVLP